MSRFEFKVPEGVIRNRLEDVLFDRYRNLSRMYIRDVINAELCEVNGRVENKGKRVSAGDFIEIEIDLDRETAMRPQDIPLDIVYEDIDLIVINKPAGMLVHPTHRDKNGTLLNALTFYLNRSNGAASIRPGLIHRLDRETSGLMVVAKNVRSHRLLAGQFHRKTVHKQYVALLDGRVEDVSMTLEMPIGRFAEEKRWGSKEGGKPAMTKLRVRERFAETTLVELEPVTGRTNQLRIHCAEIGHPIIGDLSRGGRKHSRLCLHAFRLSFRQPSNGENLAFETAIPPEFSIS